MKVLIIGGGKVGYYLAATLLEHGHDPTVIELSKERCSRLANDLDIPVICGDGTLIQYLKNAEIEKMDAVVSVTGKDENNLISCQLAKNVFRVPKTVSRVNNPKNAEVMQRLGVDITVSSTNHLARLLEREVDSSSIKQLVSLNMGESVISEIQIPHNYKLHGIHLNEIEFPEEAIIVSIIRNGRTIIPRGNSQIMSDDKLLILTDLSVSHHLMKILKL